MHSSIGCTLLFPRLFKQKFASTPYFLVQGSLQGSRPVSVSRLPDSLSIAPVMNTTMSFDELKMPVIVNKKPRLPIHDHWHLHRGPQRHLRCSCKKIFTARVTVRHGPDNVIKQGNRDITRDSRRQNTVQQWSPTVWAMARQFYFASRCALQRGIQYTNAVMVMVVQRNRDQVNLC